MIGEVGGRVTYEYQDCVEIVVVFFNIVYIVLDQLSLAHCVKVNAGTL